MIVIYHRFYWSYRSYRSYRLQSGW